MALEFKIELSGNFSGALEKDAAAAEKAEGATKKHRHELELFESEVGKAKTGLAGFEINLEALSKGGALFTFDLATGLREAYEVIEKIVDSVVDLGKEMVRAAADAQDLNLAIKLDVGEEGLEKVDKLAESFGDTRFSPKAIKEALLPLLEESGDEHSEQWDDLVTAATDVATRRKTGVAGAKSALEALRGIEIQPQRIRGALKELGIKQKDFYSDLGDLLGISATSAEKQVKAGQIKAKTLLSVALHQIAQREGGALGEATNQGSKTLGATLDRLANLKDTLFERVADSPGMRAIQGFLDNVVNTLEGPIGTDLVKKLSDAFTTMFGDLSGPEGLEKVQQGIIEIADDVKGFIDGFRNAWPEIRAGAIEVGEALKVVAETVATIAKGWLSIVELGREASSGRLFRDIGDTLTGNHGGVSGENQLAPLGYHETNWRGVASGVIGATLQALPMALGLPHFAEGGIVNRPTVGLFGESGPEAIVPLSKAGIGGEVNITYAPQYHVTGGTDVNDQLEQFDRQARLEFSRLIDELRAA